MSFTARYHGRCESNDCHYGDNQISVGDHVDYVDDDLMHAVCAFNAENADVDNHDPESPCPLCWEYHAGECA